MRRAALALLLSLFLTACTGGGGQLSAGEYARKMNDVCRQGQERTARLDRLQARTKRELARIDAKLKQSALQGLARMRAVRPPAELRSDAQAWLASLRTELDALGELLDGTREGDAVRIRSAVVRMNTFGRHADSLARKLGATDCVSETHTALSP